MYEKYDIEKLILDLETEFICGMDIFSPRDIQELIEEKRFDRGYIEQRLVHRFEEINQKFEEDNGYPLLTEDFIENQLDIWVRN